MGFIYWVICILFFIILLPLSIVAAMIYYWYKKQFFHSFIGINQKLIHLAEAFDRFGNVLCCELFNMTLIKNSNNLFGNGKETISSVLGKNQKAGTLTKTGWRIIKWLDEWQENHAIKNINF